MTTQWVKVVNIAPRFSDIEVVVENIDMDPMKVDLRIQGAKDPDGVIRSYTWYYGTTPGTDDPLGFRITTKPETSFVLPKVTGRYYFSVIMEDSNGLRVDTKNISDSSFSTPDLLVNQNLAAPIIGLNVGKSEVAYGEEVIFTVDVKNALEKDITGNSEYRWDIDGDGFYDIKTAVPTYTFKYANPGEYKPKVKVTHKGLSATKSATITVTNKLVPDADIQIIGNKLIAYNTSTGIYQSIAWYADGNKISENKEYLYYDAGESFPKTLKIIITDGKQTEEKEFAIARNPAGSVIVKKITTPLVLLGNTDNISELPDDITWSDPEKPLYLYMGESKEDTKYYVIDTDIEIDTDLSGGREDDADNKGTASYRLGRPFRVPIGTKRVTIMKLRILADDGKELGSRQIRVTRAFIAQADLVDTTTTTTPTDGPKQYNLSQEDKDRLDRLTTLVKNIPEAERQAFTRYIDQLGDIWYDRADRAETLLQFSNTIEQNSTISPDLKERLLTQINLIYTQGQQDTEEKVLARKMIEDFLANSTYKKEIFGETPGEGLLDEIIDNPEYYDQNMSIAGRIYEEYIAIDTGLSEEAKAVIKERLLTLVGDPMDPSVVTNNPDNVDETDTGGTSLMTYIKKYGVIVGGIMIVILGIMVLMAVLRRGSSSVPDFPSNESPQTNNSSSQQNTITATSAPPVNQ
jgi:PKD repeat protein